MRVVLVRPASRDRRFLHRTSWAWETARTAFVNVSRFKIGTGNDLPPLGLLTLAAVTPNEVEIVLVDEEIEDIDFETDADLVGITAMTITANRAYEIADEFRRRGVPVVLGGIHPTVMPHEAALHADSVVLGEADEIWPEIVRDAAEHLLRPTYRQAGYTDLGCLAHARRDLIKPGTYLCDNLIQATRGCPNDCAFCSIHVMTGRRYRCRPIAEVVAEIEAFSSPIVAFVDDNIVGNPSYAKELFRALVPLGVRWYGQGSLDIVKDPELLELAEKSGCTILLVGFESLRQETVSAVGKSRTNRVESYGHAMRQLHAHGISVQGSFILGLDHDDTDVFARTAEFVQRHAVDTPLANVLVPHPGTRVRASLESEGRIVHSDWDEYGRVFGRVAYRPMLMSAEELREGQLRLHKQMWSLPATLSRIARAGGNYLPNTVVGLKQWQDIRKRATAMSTAIHAGL
jgi:radical SAM superfamily enzyme YgiQ (UPF0313 family)